MVSGLPSKLSIQSAESIENLALTPAVQDIINQATNTLGGSCRRIFMAKTVDHLGQGGQRKAEIELGWDRGTIRKGMYELNGGIICLDNFRARGRKSAEQHLPKLLDDITAIAEPTSHADPTFHTTQAYTPLTAKSVHKQLLDQKGYSKTELPTVRTINTKLYHLKFRPEKVAKA